MRLLIGMWMESIYAINAPPSTDHPILAMPQEFRVLEQAAGYAVGFGLKMMTIVQNFTQLMRHYRDGLQIDVAKYQAMIAGTSLCEREGRPLVEALW